MPSEQTTLAQTTDADFHWMLGGERPKNRGLRLPPGGVEDSAILSIVRNMTSQLHQANCYASWMVMAGDEVVGLCSYRRPPADGQVEIGYGIAQSRRGSGHATRAIAAMLDLAAADRAINVAVAETAATNIASQRVLEKNGFKKTGSRTDPEDGELITWRKVLTHSSTASPSSWN